MNKVMLLGRLGKDPKLRYTTNNIPVVNLSIATDESYTDQGGNKIDQTEWHTVVVFQRQAENCCTYLAKGSLVFVEGSLQTRKWQDQQGQNRYITEIKASRIQFLDRKAKNSGLESGSYRESPYKGQSSKAPDLGSGISDVDEAFGVFPSVSSEMDKMPW